MKSEPRAVATGSRRNHSGSTNRRTGNGSDRVIVNRNSIPACDSPGAVATAYFPLRTKFAVTIQRDRVRYEELPGSQSYLLRSKSRRRMGIVSSGRGECRNVAPGIQRIFENPSIQSAKLFEKIQSKIRLLSFVPLECGLDVKFHGSFGFESILLHLRFFASRSRTSKAGRVDEGLSR